MPTKFVKEAAQEKSKEENLNFLINLATIVIVAEDTKPTKNEPQTFNKNWNHFYLKYGMKPFKRSLVT